MEDTNKQTRQAITNINVDRPHGQEKATPMHGTAAAWHAREALMFLCGEEGADAFASPFPSLAPQLAPPHKFRNGVTEASKGSWGCVFFVELHVVPERIIFRLLYMLRLFFYALASREVYWLCANVQSPRYNAEAFSS